LLSDLLNRSTSIHVTQGEEAVDTPNYVRDPSRVRDEADSPQVTDLDLDLVEERLLLESMRRHPSARPRG
jgi:hypothetical protein